YPSPNIVPPALHLIDEDSVDHKDILGKSCMLVGDIIEENHEFVVCSIEEKGKLTTIRFKSWLFEVNTDEFKT
ncbi:14790_t:CDS:2, partial [Funneliformis geosporum]